MATPEGKVKARIDKLLALYKSYLWFFSPQSGIYGNSGIPDRIACVCGHMIGIEAKADSTKKPTPLQKKCMDKIELAGGKCFVVYDDTTLLELRKYIDNVIRGYHAGHSTSKDTSTKT